MIATAWVIMLMIGIFGAISGSSRQAQFRGLLLGLAFFIIFLFAGTRSIGTDQDSVAYSVYYSIDDRVLSRIVEPTFLLIRNATEAISADNGLRYLLLFYALLGVSLKLAAILQLTSLRWLSVATYFSSYFFLHEFTQIRAAIASGLILLSVKHIQERNPFQFTVLVSLASLFHFSALIAFPLYLLGARGLTNGSKTFIALAVPLGILIRVLDVNLLYVVPLETVRSKVDVYMEAESLRDVKLNVFNAVYLVKYALLYALLLMSSRIEPNWRFFSVSLKIYALSLFAYLALSYNSTFAIRISELFGVIEVVLIPSLYFGMRSKPAAVVIISSLAVGNLMLSLYQTKLILA